MTKKPKKRYRRTMNEREIAKALGGAGGIGTTPTISAVAGQPCGSLTADIASRLLTQK
jgi:hypothetical protein